MNISGRTFVVTGGASGIGLAFAERLLSRDGYVWVLDRDERALASAKKSLPKSDRLSFVRCNVSQEAEVVETVERIDRESNGIDCLINSAAVLRDQALVSKLGGKLRKHSLADWQETINCNLTGTFLASREAVAAMINRSQPGLIVNVSSISRNGNPGQTAYAASKAAVDAITVTWSQELSPYKIRVVAIAPGFVETPMTEQIPALFLEKIREQTPVKRFGTLDEFAHTIQFVVENDYLNGTVVEVNGGLRF